MTEFKILLDDERDIWTIVKHLAVSELLANNAVGLHAYRPFYEVLFDRVYYKVVANSDKQDSVTTSINPADFDGYKQLIAIDASKVKEVRLIFAFLSLIEKEYRLTDRHILDEESMLRLGAYVDSRKTRRISNQQSYLENLYNQVFF